MNQSTHVVPLPEMPTQWRIFGMVAFWWILMPVVLPILGGVLTGLWAGVPHERIMVAVWGWAYIGSTAACLVVVIASWQSDERRNLASGRADRTTLQYLTKRPVELLFQRNLTRLWEEAVRKVAEQEAQEREEAARVARVEALRTAVPEGLAGCRGRELDFWVSCIRDALEGFHSEDAIARETPLSLLKDLYVSLARAVVSDGLEYLGAWQIWPAKLSPHRHLAVVESKILKLTCDVGADVDEYAQVVVQAPENVNEIVARLLTLIENCECEVDFM